MLPLRLLAVPALLGIFCQPSWAYPVNFGNSYVPAPAHGLLLALPSMAVNGGSMGGWGYVDLGVAEGLSVTVDSLYLNLPGLTQDFGTTFLGLSHSIRLAPGMSARISPLLGLKSGQFGRTQVALRGYLDVQLPHGLMLYTMPGYYQPLEGGFEPSIRFNAALEKRLGSFVSAALEVLSGAPSWEFGSDTRLAVAPGVTLSLGAYSFQASLRTPLLPTATAKELEAPIGVLSLGYGW